MSLKHGLLGLLTYKPMTGYELMKVLKDSLSFFWTAQTSQIYRELESLEKNGWVLSEEIIQSGKPNKKEYSLTKSGHEALNAWLNGHSALDVMKTRDAMTMRVFFGSEGDTNKLISELLEYKKMNLEFIHNLKAIESILDKREEYVNKPGEKKYWIMAMRRGFLLANANIDWSNECLEIFDEMEGK